MQLKCITSIDYTFMYMYPSSPYKNSSYTMEKIRSNSWENLTQSCHIVVNLKVWEKGRGKQAAGKSRAPGRVMWTKCLPRDTVQPTVKYFIFVGFNFRGFLKINKFVGL